MNSDINLLDIDSIVEDYIKRNKVLIKNLHLDHLKNSNDLSIQSSIEEFRPALKTGCVCLLNKCDSETDFTYQVDTYLLHIINDFLRKKSHTSVSEKKKSEYICPGCSFLKKETHIFYTNNVFSCSECKAELKIATDSKNILLFKTFSRHNKSGYRCPDCDRFMPHPMSNTDLISCPYFDCCFTGEWASIKRMHHPAIQINPEKLILDNKENALKDNIANSDNNQHEKVEITEDLERKIAILKDIIESQSNSVPYNSSDFTVKHKILVYQSFDFILKSQPVEMVNYLLNSSRSGGFQHKIFQHYVKLIEDSLPFSFKKKNVLYTVNSLLDDNLNIFDGISNFESIVTDKNSIKNETKEFYIGGRKASYSKPYYIGKLLSVIDKDTGKSIMENVTEYSFSKIKLKNVNPATTVSVSHLRIVPHYEMGAMTHINRIRKKIVDKATLILSKENNNEQR